jgi:hypothetical protein
LRCRMRGVGFGFPWLNGDGSVPCAHGAHTTYDPLTDGLPRACGSLPPRPAARQSLPVRSRVRPRLATRRRSLQGSGGTNAAAGGASHWTYACRGDGGGATVGVSGGRCLSIGVRGKRCCESPQAAAPRGR